MSLLTISRSSFLFRYPITCLSNDSCSSSGAFSPVVPFSGNKCPFYGAWLVYKPEMIMFFLNKCCSRSSILASDAPICLSFLVIIDRSVYQAQCIRDLLFYTRQFINFSGQIVDKLFERSDVIRIARHVSNRRKHI